MKKFLGFLTLSLSLNSWAQTYDFTCQVTHNLAKVFETDVTIKDGERNKFWGEMEEFRFFLTSKDDHTFELQSYEMNTPTRSYATARLLERNSFVELSHWSREYLLEVRCTLK